MQRRTGMYTFLISDLLATAGGKHEIKQENVIKTKKVQGNVKHKRKQMEYVYEYKKNTYGYVKT